MAHVRDRLTWQLRSLFRSAQWNIGIVHAPIHTFLTSATWPDVHWLPDPPRTRFLADPFGLVVGGRLAILAEVYDFRTQLGSIAALEVLADKPVSGARTVIPLSVHMSYPYIFQAEGQVYCVPETHQARQVELFRAVIFPYRWERVATLLDNVALVDATVFRHGSYWWLLGTDTDADIYGFGFLNAWYAREVQGPWRAHSRNPVKIDVRSSRPAGTPFEYEGRLYRPAQDCSGTYGGSVVLNQIDRLTPTEFSEKAVRVIRPDPKARYSAGVHTISAAGDITLVDGKRDVFIPWAFAHALLEKSRKAIRISTRLRPRASSFAQPGHRNLDRVHE